MTSDERKRGVANVLFPNNDISNISHSFEVTDTPVVIRAFNTRKGDKLLIEQSAGNGCENLWGPLVLCTCQEGLIWPRSAFILGISGTYRLLYVRDDNDTSSFENITVTQNVAVSHHINCCCEPCNGSK